MAHYASGTVLTCGHGECGCRVRVESECGCAHPESHPEARYVCACGAPMVTVDDDPKATGSSAG
ncbi:MAG: metallothionein [Pseudonocardiales bacterium]|nr:metallothionein [Pseudonocardiales bacterium]MBV9029949.1 metallothionein [Pseudonocardiales bacterium]MBW0009261.1 metallothionein [Pseudonocardiales bacterium]